MIAAPSVLACDFTDIAAGLDAIHRSGAAWIHLDIMDGHFVPNISFGPKMVQDIRAKTSLTLDVHLMIAEPDRYIAAFADAGADVITFHAETVVHGHRLIQQIRETGSRAGVSIVPSTPVATIEELLPFVDLVLVMTVNPGFGGQSLIPETLEKVSQLAARRRAGRGSYRISVDGGVNAETAPACRKAGADVLVSGSAFFTAEDPMEYRGVLEGTDSHIV